MPQVAPVSGNQTPAPQQPTAQDTATNAFGLGFEDLLKIVLTQLTYQDPLKPVENFEFVSQLAQFSQIQQTQTMSDRLTSILQAEATAQATGVLGRIVDIPAGETVLTGKVKAISFERGEPRLTIETADDRTISSIALSTVTRIASED
jgi:flagellar basal-body rod modification protein FlgD